MVVKKKTKTKSKSKKKPHVKAGTSNSSYERRKKLFVEGLFRFNHNQTQAAVFAGYKEGKAAEAAGWRLCSDVGVQEMIAARREAAFKSIQMGTNELLAITASIARSDLRHVFDEKGALLPVNQWPPEVSPLISSIEVVEMAGGMKISVPSDGGDAPTVEHIPMYTKKIKLWDKLSALDKLFRHYGLFEKDNKQQQNPLAALLQAIDGTTKTV